MKEAKHFRALSFGKSAWRAVVALGMAGIAGCAGKAEALPSTGDPELIGGQPADANHFRSTVGISDDCTAAKVGPRLFLTAAHCVSLARPNRSSFPPPDFPPNGGVHDRYLPGNPLLMFWGLDAADGDRAEFTIVKTTIHPSWWACPTCQDAILDDGAADVAVIEIGEDTPQIPEARVELASIATGTPVVKVGWGCEERTNVDANTLQLGRYKTADASIISGSEIRRFDTPMTDEQFDAVDASYLVTAGHDQDEKRASLCLGDSGGPLYLRDGRDPRIVGVNADYSFRPVQEPDLGGVSWTDWHTRTSLEARHGVGQWLIDLKVKTVGGH
ncbi:MAG TPA: trypsin-like serine protease [Polyangiaceae bacterium]|nr:trypsin-like serine protease [Polyangiaceae bacterium]